MNKIMILLVLCLTSQLSGCATSTYSYGNNFDAQNIEQIEKGKSTKQDILRLFGEPSSISAVSSNEVAWTYLFSTATSKAQSYLLTTNVHTEGKYKMMTIIFNQEDIVTNFTYHENRSTPNFQTHY